MSNVVNINKYRNIDVPDDDISFPVEEQSIFIGDDPLDGWKAITSDGDLISIVRDTYQLVPFVNFFGELEDHISKSDLDTTNMMYSSAVTHGGSRAIREYVFPEHTVNLGGRDDIMLRIVARSSYDESLANSIMVGAFRLLCSNGMIIGEVGYKALGRHTKNYSNHKLMDRLDTVLPVFAGSLEKWLQWKNTRINMDQFDSILSSFPQITKRLSEKIQERALIYAHGPEKMGFTLWAVYNAMTYWASHGDIRKSSIDNQHSIRMDRSQKVIKAINSKAWSKIAA